MWSDCKFFLESGINTLLLRSLVRLDERNQFWMHDHIRDLGRAIICGEDSQHPWKRNRIWSYEDALDILKSEEGSDRIEILRVNMYVENLELTDKEFKKLSGLRYLQVFGTLIGYFKGVLPNLRWLRLQNCRSIPSDLNMKKLVILEMQNCPVKDDWKGWSGTKVASNLKAIHLQYCDDMITAPDLSQCISLESIDLRDCRRMSGEFHIGNLLKNLKLLSFSGTEITKLTGDIGTLENLHVFDAGNLREFPSDDRKLSCPEILNLESQVLNITELKDLEILCLHNCDKLQLSGGLWKLSKLRKLELKYLSCSNSLLVEDGSSTGFLLPSSLNSLDIPGLQRLPNFANLNNLTDLKLAKFQVPEIQGLGYLRVLETLLISDALNLINLDGLESLSHLKTLKLRNCCVLEKLPISLANLTKLDKLSIRSCPLLYDIRGLEELRDFSLSSLRIEDCPGLENTKNLQSHEVVLEAAECLGLIHDLSSMEPLMPSRWNLDTLADLTLYCYEKYTNLFSYHYVSGSDHVPSREQFMDLSGLQNIHKIIIYGYEQLSKVYGLHKLKSLTCLSLSGCTSMRDLPDGLENLRHLRIDGCTSIMNLPECLSCLQELSINKYTQLAEVMSLERLEALTSLNITDCTSITKFPDLSALTNLSKLEISGCTGLTGGSGDSEAGVPDRAKYVRLQFS